MKKPYLWLQENEQAGHADCGCILYDNYGGRGAAISFCPLHEAAGELLEALQQCSGFIDTTRPKDGAAYVAMAETAIAKAEGGSK